MAVLRCPIPSFVEDYVKVTSWERVDGFLITPGILSGNYIYLCSYSIVLLNTANICN